MARLPRLRFLAIAVVFHLIYLYSIFDIYFVSPVVTGMRLFKVERPDNAKAPADRLVLFVGDGLRADKAFQSHPEPYPNTTADLDPRPLAPFLRSRILEHGTFGVSHTRVPTESRPGHVALIAGLYEDVSAVTTGWKLNPVHFDSVFNRSTHTWSWGSPDILPMFEQGAVPGRVDAYMYGAEEEDFSADATHLDYWVFDHVKELFAEASHGNTTLNKALRQDKVVFFLHLLGLDTTGHSYRPYSKEYLHNIKVVDEGVREMTELFQQFYKDDRTAFVFTADHGMSDWGSHGDGHPDNTRTPLIAWGSGVAKPEVVAEGAVAPGHDAYSSDWTLDTVRRHDVEQADIAALMAFLVGVEFPANSVGELPLQYLAADLSEKAQALLVNARGILEMYDVKEAQKRKSELRYRPYGPFSDSSVETRLAHVENLIAESKYEEAIEESDALIQLGLQGLRYLQTYDWLFLRTVVTLGYLGWMVFAIANVVNLHVLQGSVEASRSGTAIGAATAVYAALVASFVVSKSPVTYYAYAFFPIFFWEEVWARRESLLRGGRILFGGVRVLPVSFGAVAYIGIIMSLAVGYIHREVLTVLYFVAAFWPLASGAAFVQKHWALTLTWFVSCLAMSVFTLLPAMKTENVPLITIAGVLMAAVGVSYLAFEQEILAGFTTLPKSKLQRDRSISRIVLGIQVGLIVLSIIVTRSSALSLQAKTGLPRGNLVIGWAVFIASYLMPLAHRLQPDSHYLHRLIVIFLTCAPTFVILTISYEGLFYVAFWATLISWVRLEYEVYAEVQPKLNGTASKPTTNGSAAKAAVPDRLPNPHRPLTLPDVRIALFFIVLLQSAFFSTGNIASISSFSLESVSRLIPVFDPFSQAALLILKIMVPFALVSANLGILNKRIGVAPSSLFMVVMAVSDILTLYFFWVVKDEGSWLEIGSTITHFAIASLLSVFTAALEGLSALFISGVEVEMVSMGVMEKSEVGMAAAGATEALTETQNMKKPAAKAVLGDRTNAPKESASIDNKVS